MNKKIFVYLIIFATTILFFILFFLVYNNSRNINEKDNSNNIVIKSEKTNQDKLIPEKNKLTPISICETEDCILDKLEKCEEYQYMYNKDKNLYIAIYRFNNENKCDILVDLSRTSILSCFLKKEDLNKNSLSLLLNKDLNDSFIKSNCTVQNLIKNNIK